MYSFSNYSASPEIYTFSFIGAADLDALQLAPDDPARTGIRVVNPLREEEGVMRTTLMPGLLKAAAANVAQRVDDVRLFEIGKVFLPGDGELPDQPDRFGFVAAGKAAPRWDGTGAAYDVFDATGTWDLVASAMRLSGCEIRPVAAAPFHPGRAAEIICDGERIGIVGEIHPGVAETHGLDGRVIAGEFDLVPLVAARDPWTFVPPSTYPPQMFDLAFEVDSDVPAGDILAAIDRAGGALLENRRVFDVYEGDPIPAGRKSIAISLTVRAPDRTLSDADIAPIRRSIVEAVTDATGASLRGVV